MPAKNCNIVEWQQILNEWDNGATTYALARKYRHHRATIFSILRRMHAAKRPPLPVIPPDKYLSVVQRHEQGMAPVKIARECGVGWRQVMTVLKRYGVSRRTRSEGARRTTIDETIFDTITEESAYWAGFICADGCIRNTSVIIGLSYNDREHIQKFLNFAKSTRKITDRWATGGVVRGKTHKSESGLYSSKIVVALNRLGITSSKSTRTELADTIAFNRHFWRGMVDGDGWLLIHEGRSRTKTRTRPIIGFCGNISITDAFLKFVRSIIPECKAQSRVGTGCYRVHIADSYAMRVVNVLYQDATVALARKQAIANLIMTLNHQPSLLFK